MIAIPERVKNQYLDKVWRGSRKQYTAIVKREKQNEKNLKSKR